MVENDIIKKLRIDVESKFAKDVEVRYKGVPIACTVLEMNVFYSEKSNSEWTKQSRKMLRDMGEKYE